MKITSSLLEKIPGIVHGFGTFEEPIPQEVQSRWDSHGPQWRQVHETSFAKITQPKQECGNVDVLYSQASGIPVTVRTADCVPILMAHQSGGTVAAIHAGWRGTRAHIIEKFWNALLQEGHHPNEWVAAIGPAIGPCCYEVSEELARDFGHEFDHLGEKLAVPRNRILDLPAIQAGVLRKIGVSQVDLLRFCTKCSTQPLLHSYRREGGGVWQYSSIMIKM